MSSAKEKREQKAKEKAQKKAQKKAAAAPVEETVFGFGGMTLDNGGGRVATGLLESEPRARDIKISQFSLALHGMNLIEDTTIELNHSSRYGLVGRNGCGKSTLLKCLAAREIPIPSIFNVYLLAHEAPPTEETALEYVITSAREEIAKVEAEIERVLIEEGPESDLLLSLYDRQEELDPDTFETRASTILCGK